jgi:hypothetical protein
MTLILSRTYILDFPAAAMSGAALLCLIKSQRFSNRFYSILSGIVLSLAFLTKWSVAFCLLFPVIWFFVPVFRDMLKNRRFLFIFIVFLTIVSTGVTIWYSGLNMNLGAGKTWLFYYIAVVLIPGLITLKFLYPSGKKIILTGEEPNEGINKIRNFITFVIVFLTTALPWYLYASIVIKNKFFNDMGVPRTVQKVADSFMVMHEDLYCISNIFMLLPIIGIVAALLARNRKFKTQLLIICSMVAFFLIFLKIGIPITGERYWYLISIFLFPLSGFWVSSLGRLKKPAAITFLVLSLTALMGWLFYPELYTFKADEFDSFRMERNEPMSRPTGLMGVIMPDPQKADWEPVYDYLDKVDNETAEIVLVVKMEAQFSQLAYMAQESLFMNIKKRAIVNKTKTRLRTIIFRKGVGDLESIIRSSGSDKPVVLILINLIDRDSLESDLHMICNENKLNIVMPEKCFDFTEGYKACITKVKF